LNGKKKAQEFQPVFITGYMHSGTTMLHSMLARNPHTLSCFRETHFFAEKEAMFEKFNGLAFESDRQNLIRFLLMHIVTEKAVAYYLGKKFDVYAREVASALAGDCSIDSLYASLCRSVASDFGKGWFVEKSPVHIFYLPRILALFPDAKIIEILRDPRAILASKKTRSKRFAHTAYSPGLLFSGQHRQFYDPIWDSASWKAAVRAGKEARQQFAGQILTVHYESLISKPEHILRQLCAFLAIPYISEMSTVAVKNSAYADGPDYSLHGQAPERWKDVLSPAEVYLCQMLTGREMKECAYEKQIIKKNVWVIIPFCIGKSCIHFFFRAYHKFLFGGPVFLWGTMGSYFERLKKILRRNRRDA